MQRQPRPPLYIKIQDYFKDQIATNQLQPNQRIPSEKELIALFKMSRMTVAIALTGLANEGWIYRVPGRGSFISETMPQSPQEQALLEHQSLHSDPVVLDPQETPTVKRPSSVTTSQVQERMIGVILPAIVDYFAINLLEGIEQALANSGYYFVVMFSRNSQEREKKAIKELIHLGASGLLIFPTDEETYSEEILKLKLQGFPFVLFDRYLRGVETHYVVSDNYLGAKLATAHLWEWGHKNIAICSNTPMPNVPVEDRISGYMKELMGRGGMINPALILTDIRVDSYEPVEDHPLYRYVKSQIATAYLALNGGLGLLLYRIAQHIGLRIPEDLSIVTFDNPTPENRDMQFTYISQSESAMGQQAAALLLELLNNPDRTVVHYHKIVLTPQLISGKSTSSPKQSEE